MNFLLAMDHSRYAKRAARFLQELQFPAGSNLYVLHVIDPPQRSEISGIRSTSHWDKQLDHLRTHMLTNTRQFVKRVENRFLGENLQLHPVIGEGLAGNEIVSAIDQFKIDLAVVGHLGLSGIRRFLWGSVSEWVLNHATCSVLMVRNLPGWTRPKQPRGMKVLLAVDHSTDLQAIAKFLRLLDFTPHSCISLIHVVKPQVMRSPFGWDMAFSDVSQVLRREQKTWKAQEQAGWVFLKKIRQKIAQLGIKKRTDLTMVVGLPEVEIIKKAEQMQPDLLILGSRKLSVIQSFFLGSVSHKVVRHSPCSVLVVRQRE